MASSVIGVGEASTEPKNGADTTKTAQTVFRFDRVAVERPILYTNSVYRRMWDKLMRLLESGWDVDYEEYEIEGALFCRGSATERKENV